MIPQDPLRWLIVLVGLFWIGFGVSYVLDGDSTKLGQGLVILFPLGIGFLAVGFSKPSDVGSIEGVTAGDGGATVFHPVPARRMTSVIMMSGFMCLGIGMVLFPGEESNATDVRIIGAVIALCFAALIFFSLRGIRRGHMTVTLTPERIHQRNRLRDQDVSWEEIESVSIQQYRAAYWTVLHRKGANVMVPHQFMAADPAVFHALMVHMHEHPEDRPRLADPGGTGALAVLEQAAPA